MTTAKQKTWADLLGPRRETDYCSGNTLLRAVDGYRVAVLWRFQTAEQARRAFDAWVASSKPLPRKTP